MKMGHTTWAEEKSLILRLINGCDLKFCNTTYFYSSQVVNIFDIYEYSIPFHGQTFNLGNHLSHQLSLLKNKRLFIFFSRNNVHRHIGSLMHVLCYVGLHNLC